MSKLTVPEKYKVNYIKDQDDERDFIFQAPHILTGMNPTIDHTPMMSSVKDQGRLGSCVSFAMGAMKEWQENIEHAKEVSEGKKDHRQGKEYDLSEQWIYYNCKKIDPWENEEGTSIRYGMKVLNKIGVPCEEAWEYNDIEVGEPKRWAKMVARWAKIGSYRRVRSLNELKQALVKSPVPIGVGVFLDIYYTGSDGIVKDPVNTNNFLGGHAMCAVGYDDNRGLVKVKNSWSKWWGQDGYGYLSYDYINNFMWDAWTCDDLSVTPDMLKGLYEELER